MFNSYTRRIGAFMLLGLAVGSASAATQTKGFFCSNCVDSESARQQAIQYAAPLQCNGTEALNDPNVQLTCSAPDRKIVLGNHLTGEVYAFVVSRGSSMPWETIADPIDLQPNEQVVYESILGLRVDWEAAVIGGMTMVPEASVDSEGSSCPKNTAFDFATKPGGQAFVMDRITDDVSNHIEDYRDQRPWYRNGFGVGVTVFGTGGSLQFPDGDNPAESMYLVNFSRSEDPGTINDVLVYELRLVGVNPVDGKASLIIDFLPKASRVGGARFDQLMTGNIKITNRCLLDKLEALDDSGVGQFRVGGATLDPNSSFGAAPGGSTNGRCEKIVEFWQDGRRLYVFRTLIMC